MPSRRVLTIGTFDTPHVGHFYLLRECERYGDDVHVGVNTDEFVRQYKGEYPRFTVEERMKAVWSLGYKVHHNHSAGRELIQTVTPRVLVIGSDWATRDYYSQIDVDQEWMDDMRITMVYVPRIPGLSSTTIKERCQ